jgi:hypothetical protein
VRIRVGHVVYLGAAALLVGCSAGSSTTTTSHPVTPSSSSAGTPAPATAAASGTASPSQGLLGPLGVLPIPAGATPWPTTINGPKSRISFVKWTYNKSHWTEEEAMYARRGFVSAVVRGWVDADGSQQSIELVRFATPTGATSASDDVLSQTPTSATMLSDPAIGATGWSDPTLDTQGNARVAFIAVVGATLILVFEYTAATPDPAAAKALLERQYDSLKNTF